MSDDKDTQSLHNSQSHNINPQTNAYNSKEETPILTKYTNNYDVQNLGIQMESPPFQRISNQEQKDEQHSSNRQTFLKKSERKQTKSFLLLQKWQAQKRQNKLESKQSSLVHSISQPTLNDRPKQSASTRAIKNKKYQNVKSRLFEKSPKFTSQLKHNSTS